MRLEDLDYQILDRWKIEIVSHNKLLWKSKQIIRLREGIYNKVNKLLNIQDLSLYNAFNPINTDLIRNYNEDKNNYNIATLSKIVEVNEKWPIIDWESLKQVEILKMKNIRLEEISDDDLSKTIIFNWKKWSVYELLNWLSKEFYKWTYSQDDFYKMQYLFFRQINLI